MYACISLITHSNAPASAWKVHRHVMIEHPVASLLKYTHNTTIIELHVASILNSSSRVGFNVPPNTGHIGDDFYWSHDPTNSVKHWRTIVGQSTRSRTNPTRPSPLQGSTIKSKDTEVLGGLTARPNEIKARSSRPSWKNCSLWLCNVHCWHATQYYSTETVLLIFPFLQTNITVQMRPSGG